MEMLIQRVDGKMPRCVILTSGTLAPLDSFAQELGLSFPVQLENPHVVGRQQVWAGVVPQGPQNKKLNSSFANRSSAEYIGELGSCVVNVARLVPDGVLVRFCVFGFFLTYFPPRAPSIITNYTFG